MAMAMLQQRYLQQRYLQQRPRPWHTSCGSSSSTSSCGHCTRHNRVTVRIFFDDPNTLENTQPYFFVKTQRCFVLKSFLGGLDRLMRGRSKKDYGFLLLMMKSCLGSVKCLSLFSKSIIKKVDFDESPLVAPCCLRSSQSCTQRQLHPLPLLAAQSQYACMPRASHLPTLQ